MKQVGKLCKGMFDALLVLVIVTALALLLVPRLLGAKLLVVLSQSMEPNMPMGSIVVSRPVPASEIEVGDAITFQSPDPADQSALITHRVVELVGSGIAVRFRTQGDAVEEPDLRLVAPQHLVGRVWFSVPYLGYAVHFMRAPLGFILFLGLPTVLLVGGEIQSMVRAAKKKAAREPEHTSQDTLTPNKVRPQTSPSLSLGERLRDMVKAVEKKTAHVAEHTPPNAPISEAPRGQTPPTVHAQDVPLWQQVQALQAHADALQAEVTMLRQQLEHETDAQQTDLEREQAHILVLAGKAEPTVKVELAAREQEGTPPPERALPTVIEEQPATRQTPQGFVERLTDALAGWAWLGIFAGLIAVFLLVNFGLPGILPASLTRYVAQPLLWTYMAVQAFLCWKFGLETRPSLNVSLVIVAGLIGAFQLALFFGAGLLFGFDRSPDDFQLSVLLGNLVCVGTLLAGMEISRAYLVATFSRRHPWLALTLLSLLFSLFSVPLSRFEGTDSVAAFFQSAGETLLPVFCQNLLASLLALIGGPVASLAYLSPLLAFEWLSPIQPGPQWVAVALLGSIVPLLGSSVVRWKFLRQPARERKTRPNETGSSGAQARERLPFVLLVTSGIAQMLRGPAPARTAETPFNPQGGTN